MDRTWGWARSGRRACPWPSRDGYPVRIFLPNSANLRNLESFIRKFDPSDISRLEVTFHDKYVGVHPAVLAMTACAGVVVREAGGTIDCAPPVIQSLQYPTRMKLFDHLGVEPPEEIVEHESSGRFIPVTRITTAAEMDRFMVDITPLFHAQPEQAESLKYLVSELVRNALEHSGSRVGAFVCAQYYSKTDRIAIGVADAGIGIKASMSRSYKTRDSLEAIMLALRPGITGMTKRFGGTDYNAGLGLFFTKCIACATRNFFVAYSGDGFFKLKTSPETDKIPLYIDPSEDRSTTYTGLPSWSGTVIGVDISMTARQTFQQLMSIINRAYRDDLRSKRRQSFRRPKFT